MAALVYTRGRELIKGAVMTQKRKLEKKIINGVKCERYEGDTLWVISKEQS